MSTSAFVGNPHPEHGQSQGKEPSKAATAPFHQYFDPAVSLESRLQATTLRIGLDQHELREIWPYLENLKRHHPATYEHSIRVGLVASAIGAHLGLHAKPLLIAGLLHDIGKLSIPASVLDKRNEWLIQDETLMRAHVMHGYEILKAVMPFIADIVVRHHFFQSKNPYPQDLPRFTCDYSPGMRATIHFLGRILALADSYDALHRDNSRSGNRPRTGADIKEDLLNEHQDIISLIESLYQNGILTTSLFTIH